MTKLLKQRFLSLSLPFIIILLCAGALAFTHGRGTELIMNYNHYSSFFSTILTASVSPIVLTLLSLNFLYSKKLSVFMLSAPVSKKTLSLVSVSAALILSLVLTTAVYGINLLSFTLHGVEIDASFNIKAFTAIIYSTVFVVCAATFLAASLSGKPFCAVSLSLIITYLPFVSVYLLSLIATSTIQSRIHINLETGSILTYYAPYCILGSSHYFSVVAVPVSLALALVFFVTALLVLSKRDGGTVGQDFVFPVIRHIAASLLSLPLITIWVLSLEQEYVIFDPQYAVLLLGFLSALVFFVYFYICVKNPKKLLSGIISFALCFFLALSILFLSVRYTTYCIYTPIPEVLDKADITVGIGDYYTKVTTHIDGKQLSLEKAERFESGYTVIIRDKSLKLPLLKKIKLDSQIGEFAKTVTAAGFTQSN